MEGIVRSGCDEIIPPYHGNGLRENVARPSASATGRRPPPIPASSRPRVGLLVDLLQVSNTDMGIDLGGRQIDVAK